MKRIKWNWHSMITLPGIGVRFDGEWIGSIIIHRLSTGNGYEYTVDGKVYDPTDLRTCIRKLRGHYAELLAQEFAGAQPHDD